MKIFILSILSVLSVARAFSQGKVVTVLNDSTELQQFDGGQKLKVSYLLNGSAISLKDKDKLLAKETYVQQEFNIKTSGTEIVGEVNLLLPDQEIKKKEENSPLITAPKTVDISKNLRGTPFPAFNWTDMNGNKLTLADLRGKTVVLNFWHTSCIPCVAEIPLLNALSEQYAGKDVVFIASTSNNDSELKKFLGKTLFTYKQVPAVDPRSVFDPFPGWPVHIVLDGEGMIKFYALGKQKDIEQKLMKSIDESLSK